MFHQPTLQVMFFLEMLDPPLSSFATFGQKNIPPLLYTYHYLPLFLGGGGLGTSTWILHHFALPLLQLSGTATLPRLRILGWLINFDIFRVIFHTTFPYQPHSSVGLLNKTTHFNQPKKRHHFWTPSLHSVCLRRVYPTSHVCAAVWRNRPRPKNVLCSMEIFWRPSREDVVCVPGMNITAKAPETWCLEDYPVGMAYLSWAILAFGSGFLTHFQTWKVVVLFVIEILNSE